MNISLKQQVTATYARNNFKAVTEKALKEGVCFIMRKSKPTTVVLSMKEYEETRDLEEKYKLLKQQKTPQITKKITLEELRKDTTFDKYAGTMQDEYPGMTALDLQHNWFKYVD